jgi:hypothetical protein
MSLDSLHADTINMATAERLALSPICYPTISRRFSKCAALATCQRCPTSQSPGRQLSSVSLQVATSTVAAIAFALVGDTASVFFFTHPLARSDDS